jgi:hypothetical protein
MAVMFLFRVLQTLHSQKAHDILKLSQYFKGLCWLALVSLHIKIFTSNVLMFEILSGRFKVGEIYSVC